MSVIAQMSSGTGDGDGDDEDDGTGVSEEADASAMGRVSPILEAQRSQLPRRKYKERTSDHARVGGN